MKKSLMSKSRGAGNGASKPCPAMPGVSERERSWFDSSGSTSDGRPPCGSQLRHYVFRRDLAQEPGTIFKVIVVFHDGDLLLLGTTGNQADAEFLRGLVDFTRYSSVAFVRIDRRKSTSA